MSELVRKKLTELVDRFGVELTNDPRRCEGLLRDFCGTHRREIFVLVSAVREGVGTELTSLPSGLPSEVVITRLVERLHDNFGVAKNLARWAVESWALALGAATSDDFHFPFSCPGCNAQGTIATRMAGQSTFCPKCKVVLRVSDDGRAITIKASAVVSQKDNSTVEDDLFADFPRVSSEEVLRKSIRDALADGLVTDEERLGVKRLCDRLGVKSDVAARILAEVKAEMNAIPLPPVSPPVQAKSVADVTSKRWVPTATSANRLPKATAAPDIPTQLSVNPNLLMSYLGTYAKEPGFYLNPQIPTQKLQNARVACAVPQRDIILALIDCTVWGSAKNCVLFGEEGLYYHNADNCIPCPGYIAYHALQHLVIKSYWVYCISFGNAYYLSVAGGAISRNVVLQLLLQIKGAIR